MSSLVLHMMGTGWTTSDPARLQVAVDPAQTTVPDAASTRLAATAAPGGARAELTLPAARDLGAYEELRFWVRGDRPADGSPARPFYLEVSYADDADAPGEEHRWYVPVTRAQRWEQRRIGIEGERRGAVRRLRFSALRGPFRCHLQELLAVRDELVRDAESALADTLSGVPAGGPRTPVAAPAAPGDAQIVITHAPAFTAGNRILVTGGSAGAEVHDVASASHQPTTNTTTLGLSGPDRVRGTLAAGSAVVAVYAPVVADDPAAVQPAIVATLLDAREDPQRSQQATQRDSFRARSGRLVWSSRPGARAFALDYRLVPEAGDHALRIAVHQHLLERLARLDALRVNGALCPVQIVPAPAGAAQAAVYLRIGTRLEVAPRTEQPPVERLRVAAAPQDAPDELEVVDQP